MSIEKKTFGVLSSGEEISLYILRAGEFQASLTDYGAILVSLVVPDRRGIGDDVLLGFSTLSGYTLRHPYFGATVGRFANRIAGGRFPLDGMTYSLDANDGPNSLHGGLKGFDRRIWKADVAVSAGDRPSVVFSRRSADGEEGYPGNLDVMVRFTLGSTGALSIEYAAKTDRRTPVNLTNHAYFNLAGEGRGTVLGHEMRLACSEYLPVNQVQIPVGRPVPVEDGPFDFRTAKPIGRDMSSLPDGYDHCFVVDRAAEGPIEFAEVYEPRSGRRMRVSTTLPAVQFYTGNKLEAIAGKRGSLYGKHSGFCLETQFYPDSPNRPDFPDCILDPGTTWKHETVYRFG